MKTEQRLQESICQWLRLQYPSIYFMSDASGLPIKSWGLRNLLKNTRSCHAALDIVILEPRGTFGALILEIKKETPFKKDGTLKKNEHLAEQQKTITLLNEKGYWCFFVWDFEQARDIIGKYLALKF